jgi:hypothetical protein
MHFTTAGGLGAAAGKARPTTLPGHACHRASGPIGALNDADAATMLNVGERSVERAQIVQREAVPARLARLCRVALTAPDAPRKRLPAWGAEADARFLWPQGRWHCRRWPRRALALSALVATEVVVREAGSINPPSA